MKITKLETFIVDAYRANYVFVKLHTDEGIEGVGEGTVEMKEQTVAAAINELGDYLIGKDPFATDYHLEIMNRDSYWRTGVILRSALSAVEGAMLDIKGKALNVPVYELLGGRHRDKVLCYANGWFRGARTADEFAKKAASVVANGFKALKWDPFGSAHLTMSRSERREAIEIVEAVRDAVGSDVDLMIEGHGRFDIPTALSVARDLVPFDPLWFEEPLPPESIEALAAMRRKSPVPIAAGERYFELSRFQQLIRAEAADFIQPDISHVGGLGEARRIAAMANINFLPICPHNPLGPVTNAMTLQFAAATPNLSWFEMMVDDIPWRSEVAKENLHFEDGYLKIPCGPGLGVELNTEAMERYPYKRHPLRHYSGVLTDIRPPNSVPYYTKDAAMPNYGAEPHADHRRRKSGQ